MIKSLTDDVINSASLFLKAFPRHNKLNIVSNSVWNYLAYFRALICYLNIKNTNRNLNPLPSACENPLLASPSPAWPHPWSEASDSFPPCRATADRQIRLHTASHTWGWGRRSNQQPLPVWERGRWTRQGRGWQGWRGSRDPRAKVFGKEFGAKASLKWCLTDR